MVTESGVAQALPGIQVSPTSKSLKCFHFPAFPFPLLQEENNHPSSPQVPNGHSG